MRLTDPCCGSVPAAPPIAVSDGLAAQQADGAAGSVPVALAEEELDDGGDALQHRSGYIFGKKYNVPRLVRVHEGSGLQSIDKYENLGLVGRGAFNKIYKARHRETGEVVALKAMQLAALEQAGRVQGDEGIPLEMAREMSILLSMRHPNA